jgi:hypothetical protein
MQLGAVPLVAATIRLAVPALHLIAAVPPRSRPSAISRRCSSRRDGARLWAMFKIRSSSQMNSSLFAPRLRLERRGPKRRGRGDRMVMKLREKVDQVIVKVPRTTISALR